MECRISKRTVTRFMLFIAGSSMTQMALQAQGPGGGRGGPPPSPQAGAPIDLTGYWVSVVTEDWRYRMVTPAPGDYFSVPMTAAARKVADTWDPEKEEASGDQCKSYGAPAILRVPEHLHITWQDDHTLRMDTDAGKQTRVFHFGDWKAPAGPPTLQGDSVAAVGNAAHQRSSRGQCAAACKWIADRIAEGHDNTSQGRLSAQERCSLQRERQSHGVLRSGQVARWGSLDGGDHRNDRPLVFTRALYHQFTFQETGRCHRMESH